MMNRRDFLKAICVGAAGLSCTGEYGKKMVQSYQASADFADQMVGRLVDKLDATGQAENTIVILWAAPGFPSQRTRNS